MVPWWIAISGVAPYVPSLSEVPAFKGVSICLGVCKKHNLTYNCASFWMANVFTYNTLGAVALQDKDVSNPVPKNLVWEALNTHG
ncbi:unnamed protein product [Linum trigynum]|uniref:Uncharacterized protein n=1 Tax=Linum trigynum TaxID=586398 RepID=A0AAV2CD24_9ROSI